MGKDDIEDEMDTAIAEWQLAQISADKLCWQPCMARKTSAPCIQAPSQAPYKPIP